MKQFRSAMFFFMAAVMLLVGQSAMAAENPRDMLQKAGNALLDRLVKDKAAYKRDPQVLYDIVEKNIEPYVDFEGFAKGVMGQYYRQASDAQRAQFTTTFRKSLIRTYANGMAAYDNQKIVFKPYAPGDDPKKAQVDMDIMTASNGAVPVTYQLVLNAKDEWKVKNVIINGMNLGLTFRNQFASTVESSRGNLDKAIVDFIPAAEAVKKGQ
ncbi:phospholipid transport system substrate-binding protein [Fluviicoccus keumensis]|uniref:Phospholipid transport system substrate-binding protein n=1 Tax=Fluviicoccus keumensis TaxID=1435465 RepID=A0A4Q7YED3_9GAMM|nr:ABC transporter substrate-binding protein [Fluviicoccus keumensis]RZU35338.1 phospholipid transport system substrate-binding protein [Fluviicoccus keumensis]